MTSGRPGNTTELLQPLARLAAATDRELSWPEASWRILQEVGALRWAIPREQGGDGLSACELLEAYENLASACLTTCFILSQRDAAIRRIRDHGSPALIEQLLPPLARGERFTTVGLSQLTTSRQHGKPAVIARVEGDDFIIDGAIPWVTGACRADHLVVGAMVEEAGQILAIMPADLRGVQVGPPLELMALQGSMTAEVRCEGVRLSRRWLLYGPGPPALQALRGGTGGLETSCLALGLAGGAIAHLREEAGRRPELGEDVERLEKTQQELRQELFQLAEGEANPKAGQAIRAHANTLVLHATQAALTASKGAGFLCSHPAQRWARQALFFLVWSCPATVASATMHMLSKAGEELCL